ncbi:MAG: CBS domain-containing protein [Deltaproteobacteria bacterium]|nr:CBS domain-containing protein [Deltaproteobacteria bacterium]
MSQIERRKIIQAKTVITTHVNPDFDAVASMVAATKLYPGSVMLFPGGQGRNIRSFFIQSLIYLFDVARPRELEYGSVERLVVVDTRQRDRLGAAAPCLDNPGLDIHLYDHHPDGPTDLKGSFELVDRVGANATLMTELLAQKKIALSPQEATMLALGLYEDTGGLTFSSTTPRDLMAGATLLSWGADLSVVSDFTSRELTPEQLSLLNELILTAESREARGRNLVIAMARREEHIEDVAVLAHKMMDILGADILFLLIEMENMVQVVARSNLREVDVGEITLALGGGGHAAAAAAAIRGKSMAEVKEELEKCLTEVMDHMYSAGNVMVHPPIVIFEEKRVSEAMEMMVHYSLNVLLVEDSAKKVSGIVTDHIAGKAIYHGLDDYTVKEVMVTEFQTAQPDTTFGEINRIIVGQGQRILPVIDPNGRALGVITRTDLLRLMSREVTGGLEEARRRGTGLPYERNLLGIMEDRLPARAMNLVRDLSKIAKDLNLAVYLVGGTVRDMIMLKGVSDLDVSVAGDMTKLLEILPQKMPVKKIKRHPRFQTATIFFEDGWRLDLSSARVEYYERPGALPVVSQASIQLDLQRRDFTINALAISLNEEDFGRLFDFYRGFQDIKEGLVRVLHSLSIIEDPTRAFRAVRFATRLGFKISKMTQGLIENAVRGGFLHNTHPRRLLTELRYVFEETETYKAMELVDHLGLLSSIHPDLKLTPNAKALIRQVDRVRDWFHLTFGREGTPFWLVYFLAITEPLAQDELERLAQNLDTNRKEAKLLLLERPKLHRILARNRRNGPQELKPSEIDKLLSPLSWPAILYLMAKGSGEFLDRAGATYLAVYRRVSPIIDGADLLALGLKPGPSLQKALSALRLARLDGEVSTIEDEKAFARKHFLAPASAPASGDAPAPAPGPASGVAPDAQ